ncbi:MAG: 2-oxoacid:acceptor oxidoreductase subunit alpha [Planctomycetota bacterium]|jgi:2-oxoglutarate ferredoxin oxidoreductase subunit alpha
MNGSSNRDDISIVLCGQAGQGIRTVESLLIKIVSLAGFNVFSTKEYMSRIRGGANSTQIRASSGRVCAFTNRIDIFIPLDTGAFEHVKKRISSDTIILADKSVLSDGAGSLPDFIDVPFNQTALQIGNKVYSNLVAVGTICALLGIDIELIKGCVESFFLGKAGDVVERNIEAVIAGYNLGKDLQNTGKMNLGITAGDVIEDDILLNGSDAVALGAIAGGCNFISSYPMSPSTGVLVSLAKNAGDFGIIAEQAEDEIAAINMAIGAWYAGARAMVSTSGGGFALMTEGISLCGMLETPVVVHLAQRPGPATGLPTRTEQADLELALYAGHGEFSRIVLAPGDIQQAFYLTQKAFNLADKFQIPVIILTDQFLMDSYYNISSLNISGLKIEKHILETKENYARYELTKNGISPRGVPGFGKGLVAVDSDEHDEYGHITENLEMRVKMVNKRLKKKELIDAEIIQPELTGPDDYKILVVCWGSTRNTVIEAVSKLDRDDISVLHFQQVYPLHQKTVEYLGRAKGFVIVENNATSQLGKLIKLYLGFDITKRILKYNGVAFAVEELQQQLMNF